MIRTSLRRGAGLLLGVAVLAGPSLVHDDPQDTAPWPRQGRYVGPTRCIECHDDEADAIAEGVHADVVHSEHTMGCETCHGPGHAHATDADNDPAKITYPGALPPADQLKLCGRCHGPEAAGHGGGGAGGFLAAGRGCTECHPVHEARSEPPAPGVRFVTRTAADAAAETVAAERCAGCHPLQAEALGDGPHRSLGPAADVDGCTTCHGAGSMHVETGGLARLITRPDRARDGDATCRSCHETVDPVHFHWPDGEVPLGAGPWLGRVAGQGALRCTTCHSVHDTHRRDSPPETTNRLCASCHAPAFGAHPGTAHARLGRLDTPLSAGCGSCHSGALEHARSGGRRDPVESLRAAPRAVQEAACLQCHERDPALHELHAGDHARHDVSCLDCHSPAVAIGRAAEDADARCAQCHTAVAAKFRLPNHHPVPERAMQCSSCHEPHGARGRVRDLHLTEDRCVDCHREYRGPFVFAHQAGRRQGCVVCHEPHGSPNRRLLLQATTQQNCIACHGDFPAFHDQTSGSVFTNCLNCHTRIHGSNHSRFLFR